MLERALALVTQTVRHQLSWPPLFGRVRRKHRKKHTLQPWPYSPPRKLMWCSVSLLIVPHLICAEIPE